MNAGPRQSQPPTTLGYFAVLTAVLVLLVTFRGGSLEFPWIVLAFALLLPAAVLAGRERLARDATLVAVTVGAALWLLIVQRWSIDAQLSLPPMLALCIALGTALVAALLRDRGAGPGLLALVAVFGLGYGLWAGLRIEWLAADPYAFRDRNVAADGVFLGVLAALAALLLPGPRRRQRLLAGMAVLAFGTFVVAGLLTARITALMFLVAAVLVAASEFRRDRTLVLWPLAVLAVLGLLQLSGPVGVESASAPQGVRAVETGAFVRTTLASAAVDLLPARPFTGSGLLTFFLLFAPTQSPDFFHGAGMVHNDYLQVAVELGWPVALALVVLVLALLRHWYRLLPRGPERGPERTLCVAALGVFGHALLNFPLYDPTLLVLLAIVLVLARGGERPGRGRRALAERLRAPLRAAGGVAIIALVLQLGQAAALSVEAVVLRGHPPLPGIAAPRITPETGLAIARALRAADLPGGRAAFEEARLTLRAWEAGGRAEPALAAAALARFEEAWRALPHESDYGVQYARALRETGAPLAPRVRVLEDLLARRPRDARNYLALAVHALQADESAFAVEVASRRWLNWCRHGAYRGPESADLLTLAALDPAVDAAQLATCRRALGGLGIVEGSIEDLRRRFPARRVAPAQS